MTNAPQRSAATGRTPSSSLRQTLYRPRFEPRFEQGSVFSTVQAVRDARTPVSEVRPAIGKRRLACFRTARESTTGGLLGFCYRVVSHGRSSTSIAVRRRWTFTASSVAAV